MKNFLKILKIIGFSTAALLATPGHALDDVDVSRHSETSLRVTWHSARPVDVAITTDPHQHAALKPVRTVAAGEAVELDVPAHQRVYVLLREHSDRHWQMFAERALELERGSNFRDLGGYAGAGGKHVRWGAIYRSGAMPMLSEADYALLAGLQIGTIVDLRSLDERQLAPDLLDDRTGALFIANDYPFKALLGAGVTHRENLYHGVEQSLAPQYRAIFKRLLANDGAVMFHCSAGQDRTGVAAALILSALGVERQVILTDYHLSTALRRPAFEMPPIDPAAFPGNPLVAFYGARRNSDAPSKPEPLYSPSGASHLAQFLDGIDREYGGVEKYLASQLGIGPMEITRLRSLYLE
jgi:protein-tyrosine phosphatase